MARSPVLDRLRLIRVQTMALTALVPVIGSLVFIGDLAEGMVEGWNLLWDLVLLFIVGSMLHIFGFVLNEWADVEVDRASDDLCNKPLVSGEISSREALAIALVAAGVGFVPLALVTLDPLVHGMYAASLMMGGAYDIYGKRLPLDTVLAGSLTFLLLTGVLASGQFDAGSSHHMTLLVCLAGLQFMQNLFQNSIEGGIKDADHDAAAGTRTFAAVLGVRVVDGKLSPSTSFTAASVTFKAIHLAILLYAAVYVVGFGTDIEGIALWAWILAMVSMMIVTLRRFMGNVPFDRPVLKQVFSLHEMATFAATVGVFVPVIGLLPSIILLILPVLWFGVSNKLLFSGVLEPGV